MVPPLYLFRTRYSPPWMWNYLLLVFKRWQRESKKNVMNFLPSRISRWEFLSFLNTLTQILPLLSSPTLHCFIASCTGNHRVHEWKLNTGTGLKLLQWRTRSVQACLSTELAVLLLYGNAPTTKQNDDFKIYNTVKYLNTIILTDTLSAITLFYSFQTFVGKM